MTRQDMKGCTCDDCGVEYSLHPPGTARLAMEASIRLMDGMDLTTYRMPPGLRLCVYAIGNVYVDATMATATTTSAEQGRGPLWDAVYSAESRFVAEPQAPGPWCRRLSRNKDATGCVLKEFSVDDVSLAPWMRDACCPPPGRDRLRRDALVHEKAVRLYDIPATRKVDEAMTLSWCLLNGIRHFHDRGLAHMTIQQTTVYQRDLHDNDDLGDRFLIGDIIAPVALDIGSAESPLTAEDVVLPLGEMTTGRSILPPEWAVLEMLARGIGVPRCQAVFERWRAMLDDEKLLKELGVSAESLVSTVTRVAQIWAELSGDVVAVFHRLARYADVYQAGLVVWEHYDGRDARVRRFVRASMNPAIDARMRWFAATTAT